MNKNIIAYLALSIYLLATAIGGLNIVGSGWNEYQMFAGTSVISFIIFLVINSGSITFCYNTFKLYPLLCIKFGLYLTFMLLPVYFTQKHNVTYVYYCISFSLTLGLLGAFYARAYIRTVFFLILLLVLLGYYKFDAYHCIAIIGPVSAYYMLMTSKKVAISTQADTNSIMYLRYFILAMISIIALPFLKFNSELFTITEVARVFMISVFLNIVPIYCAQYITLKKSSNFFANGATLLPITIFIANIFYYANQISKLELLFSILLVTPVAYQLLHELYSCLVIKKQINYIN